MFLENRDTRRAEFYIVLLSCMEAERLAEGEGIAECSDTVFGAAGVDMCSVPALQEDERSHSFNTRHSRSQCLHMWRWVSSEEKYMCGVACGDCRRTGNVFVFNLLKLQVLLGGDLR